jgi:ABC-2 type transport system permease protein
MNSFMVQSYTLYKGLFGWLSVLSYTTNIFVAPAIGVITFALLGQFAFDIDTARYYGIGVIMNEMAFIVLAGLAQSYVYDRNGGTISFTFISPVSRIKNFLARAVLHYPNGILVYAVGLVTLWLMMAIDFSRADWPAFILAVLVVTGSVLAFSQVLGIFTLITRNWLHAMLIITGILFIFTGMIIPLETFPPVLQGFGHVLPITNALEAIRSAIAGGAAGAIYTNILQEAVIGVIYLALGFTGFVTFEKIAKRRGTLDIESA